MEPENLDDLLSLPIEGQIAVWLVDGDGPAYRAAAATDGRMYTVDGTPGAWKYKADVVKYCKEKGLSLTDIQVVFEPEPIEHALNAVKTSMRSTEMALSNHYDHYNIEVYLTNSDENFRNDINPEYKANRKGVRKPEHLGSCKSYLVKTYGAEYPPNMEADDILAVRAAELRAEGIPYCVVSQDKDLNQIPGDHFNHVTGEFFVVSPAEARENLWTQVVIGDTTDNILTPTGIGPAKAKALFKGVDWNCVSVVALEEMVCDLYIKYQEKNGKPRKATGIPPNTDFTDILCWVRETYAQVHLLEERP